MMHRQATLSRHRAFLQRPDYISIRSKSYTPTKGKHGPPPILHPDQFARVKRDTLKIIKRVVKPPIDWKHAPSLRGEEKRLAASIPLDKSIRGMSNDRAAFDAGEEEIGEDFDEGSSTMTFPLGTFIETRRNLIHTHGVVLGEESQKRRKRISMLTTSGEVWHPVPEDVVFTIPDFVSADLAARCSRLPFVFDQPRINARIQVLKHLRDLDRSTERTYNIVVQKCADLYDKVRSPNPNEWSQTTSTEIARLITRKPDITTVFSVHKYMMDNYLFFDAHHSYESTRIFRVRPKSHVELIQTILDWSRRPDSPIEGFAEKARKVIAENQKVQKLSRNEAPSYGPAVHVWTGDETKILEFLRNSLRRTRTTQKDPYSLGQSFILKQIDKNRADVSDHDVHRTLVDLGVLAPWLDPTALEPSLGLDLESEAIFSRFKHHDVIVSKGLEAIASQAHNTPLGPEDFHLTDPLEAVRHDFGDMPVYVVDEANSEELDDGVSVERIPSEPDSLWAHVHIADPASLIHPMHSLAKEASTRMASLYFIHRTWPLFPRRLMKHPTYGLSLGSKQDGPTKVLTFSGKVNGQGEVTEIRVRAGLIRNLHIITYDEVDAALGRPLIPYSYPFGQLEEVKPPSLTLTESQEGDLRDLHKIAECLVAKRQRDGVINFGRPTGMVRSIVQSPSEICSTILKPTTFKGFPTYEYRFVDQHLADAGARNMVAEMMKLASRAASRFCTQRSVPVLRRTSDPNAMSIVGDLQSLLDMRYPNNYVRYELGIPRVEMLSNGGYSLEPKAHFGIGIPDGEGYSRATSPLRRYIDLVSHWQIHHALLGSAAPPPFDTAQLSELAVTVQASDKLLQTLQRNHTRYWQLMLLKRWVEDMSVNRQHDNDILGRLEAITIVTPTLNEATNKYHAEVEIPLLGLSAALENLETADSNPGTIIPVKIQEIRLGTRPKLYVARK